MFHVTSLFGVIFQMNFLNSLTNDCSYIFPRLSRLRKNLLIPKSGRRRADDILSRTRKSYFAPPFLYSIERVWLWIWLLLPQCKHYLIKICHIHHHWLASAPLHQSGPHNIPFSAGWLKTEWELVRYCKATRRPLLMMNKKTMITDEPQLRRRIKAN